MDLRIRRARDVDVEAIIELSIAAWEPVFRSFEQVLGRAIYLRIYPDWQSSQRAGVEDVCRDSRRYTVLVAELGGVVAGFVAYELNPTEKSGEIQLLAVHPEHQNRGIGTELSDAALSGMLAAGMTLAVVGTGGDPGHAPARRSYEKAGFTPLPLVRYYKDLQHRDR